MLNVKKIGLILSGISMTLGLVGCGRGIQTNETDHSNFIFSKIENENAYSIRLNKEVDYPEKIVIPSTYKMSRVAKIESEGFANCQKITSVTIPYSVEMIYSYAFADCASLEWVVIQGSDIFIGKNTFENCLKVVFYFEADEYYTFFPPSYWNSEYRPIYWKGEWSYVNGVPTPNK